MAGGDVFVVNELLSYVKFYRNSANDANLKKVVINFYTANDTAAAKSLLADGQLADVSRRVEDLEVASRSSDVFTTDTNHASVTQSLIDLDKKVSDTFAALSARIENTNSTLSVFADQVNKVRGPPVRSLTEADNSMNIVINGVPEHRDPESWRGQVDDILQFLMGRHVDVADLFRVGGRYCEGRTRPIIVKLRSIWDHRLILGCRYKLKDYQSNRIFIHPMSRWMFVVS
jgi:hypothetical protein